MRYVVEGAQLGGRVIHRRLLEAFGVGFQEFGSFWSPDPAIQSSWPAVLKSLTRVESRDSLAEAARSARSTFRHMKIYLAVRE
jgi:heme oxygenase